LSIDALKEMNMAAPDFSEIETLLEKIISDWKVKHHREPDLLGAHETTKFSWETKDDLLASEALGLKLIQPEVIGQNPKRGKEANIVVALQTGVNGNPRMPDGGPYRSDTEIQKIIDWIDAGCPE
jgi:hypothetical protein